MSGALGRLLVTFGLAMLLVGFLLQAGPSLSLPAWLGWLGRLPGDLQIDRGGFRLLVPLGSCLAISVVLTLLLQLLSRLR